MSEQEHMKELYHIRRGLQACAYYRQVQAYTDTEQTTEECDSEHTPQTDSTPL